MIDIFIPLSIGKWFKKIYFACVCMHAYAFQPNMHETQAFTLAMGELLPYSLTISRITACPALVIWKP